jgi:hypothetical protein
MKKQRKHYTPEVSVAKLWTRSWPRPDRLREYENRGHPCSNGATSNLP